MTLLEKIKTDYEEHLKQNWTPNGRKRIGNLVEIIGLIGLPKHTIDNNIK